MNSFILANNIRCQVSQELDSLPMLTVSMSDDSFTVAVPMFLISSLNMADWLGVIRDNILLAISSEDMFQFNEQSSYQVTGQEYAQLNNIKVALYNLFGEDLFNEFLAV